jgi:polar amino acid transport system substrate-binding protein
VALINNKVDAVLDNEFAARQWAKKYEGKLAVGDAFFEDPQAILVRENDSDWRDQLNWILQELWYEKRFQAMYEKHFGYPPPFNSIWSERRLQPGVIKSGG